MLNRRGIYLLATDTSRDEDIPSLRSRWRLSPLSIMVVVVEVMMVEVKVLVAVVAVVIAIWWRWRQRW